MTTILPPDGSAAAPAGPPPPFDPELAAALTVIGENFPAELTPEMIPARRQPNPARPRPTDEDLRHGGAFEVTERLVPGTAGHPRCPCETFRDADVTYASRIWQAGGVAELHIWPGGFHGFAGLVPRATLSQAATAAHLSWLRRILGG